jgi:hypothetical protein
MTPTRHARGPVPSEDRGMSRQAAYGAVALLAFAVLLVVLVHY